MWAAVMDCNRWSLLHVVIPIVPVWTAEEYNIRLFGRRVSVLFWTSMPVASVPVYLWKTTVSLLCCIFYKLELWTSMENVHVNWYILWMLTWISRNFFQHIIYCLNAKMNFAGISHDRWHEFPGWISQELLQLVIRWLSTYMNFAWIVLYVTAAWALVRIYWKIFDAHGMQLELWAPELLNIYTCHFDCLYEFYQHYDWWTWLLYCVLCLCIHDRGWLLYVSNVVFIFVDGMRCVYPATDVSTLAVCYFIYYRDIIFSVEWREFCTVFLFLYYLLWQCHALENSPTKVGNF